MQAYSLPTEQQGKPKNTGMGSLSLLRWILLTQELNQGLLHCRWILYQLSYQGSPVPKKGYGKECSSKCTIVPISQASNVIFKILQARLQLCVNQELPVIQTGFERGRGTRDQIANFCWVTEKAREFQKNIYFHFIDKAFLSGAETRLRGATPRPR